MKKTLKAEQVANFLFWPFLIILFIWSLMMVENAGVMLVNNLLIKNRATTAFTPASNAMDQKIQDVVWEFKTEAESYGIEVNLSGLSFSSGWVDGQMNLNDTTTMAACQTFFKHIYFDEYFYSPSAPRSFKAVMYHELAHCLFDVDHDETQYNFPNLMNAADSTYWEELPRHQWEQSREHLFRVILMKQKG